MSARKKQRDQILTLLINARGNWVPLPDLMRCAAQYNARVLELRRLGFNIENKTRQLAGERHSWFRLISREQLNTAQTSKHTPELSEAAQLFSDATPATSTMVDFETGRRGVR